MNNHRLGDDNHRLTNDNHRLAADNHWLTDNDEQFYFQPITTGGHKEQHYSSWKSRFKCQIKRCHITRHWNRTANAWAPSNQWSILITIHAIHIEE